MGKHSVFMQQFMRKLIIGTSKTDTLGSCCDQFDTLIVSMSWTCYHAIKQRHVIRKEDQIQSYQINGAK